jgi:hypothetical protein
MLKSLIPAAAFAALLAGTAFAGSPSNDAQLAASAGVPAGQYTAAELINIIEARRENNQSALDYYLSGVNREASATRKIGNAELARAAGVQAGEFTVNELLVIIEAKRDGDPALAEFYASGQNRVPANEAFVVTPGEATLAALVGVDPAQYTLAELVQLNED